jgi:hypothetical protein
MIHNYARTFRCNKIVYTLPCIEGGIIYNRPLFVNAHQTIAHSTYIKFEPKIGLAYLHLYFFAPESFAEYRSIPN